jgi:hypothetical protein
VTRPDALVVGVVPYGDANYCPQAPGRESVSIKMDDENSTHCTYESGDQGEARWVAAQATKYPLPEECQRFREHTTLWFCRTHVHEEAFRPLTADPLAVEQFYAILKFGDRCPPLAIEVAKTIVNNDENNQNSPTGPAALDLLYPNEIVGDALGNHTKLHFCYFRNAPTAEQTMPGFPDLGFPYAVFHDFDGPQPGWVIRKRWQYSDDSRKPSPANRYHPEPDAEFLGIIENPLRGSDRDTCFDLARVR